jgi:hypothetical protein
MTGHVYLIAPLKNRNVKGWVKGRGTIPFKIGVSKSIEGVQDRLKALNAGNWVELGIADISPELFQPYHAELYLHGCYSKKKIRGEWFKLSCAEYKYILDLMEQEPKSREMQERGKIMRDWGGWQWWF